MEREIKVGTARFVVDDPRGMLGAVEPAPLRAEQLGLETARTREEEARHFGPGDARPNPSDPIGTIAARAAVLDGIIQGRTSPWMMRFAWFFTAVCFYPFAAAVWTISTTLGGRIVAVCIVIVHAVFFLSATATMQLRRAGKKTAFDR